MQPFGRRWGATATDPKPTYAPLGKQSFKSISTTVPTRQRSCPTDPSLNYFIRAHHQRLWDGDAERLCGLDIDDQLDSGRLLDRQVGGLGAFEDLVDVDGGATVHVDNGWAIGH